MEPTAGEAERMENYVKQSIEVYGNGTYSEILNFRSTEEMPIDLPDWLIAGHSDCSADERANVPVWYGRRQTRALPPSLHGDQAVSKMVSAHTGRAWTKDRRSYARIHPRLERRTYDAWRTSARAGLYTSVRFPICLLV